MSSKKSVKKPDFEKFLENKARKKRQKRRKTVITAIAAVLLCAVIAALLLIVTPIVNAERNALTACTWVPSGAKDASGDEAEMSDVYGVNYSSYQGSLTFNDDGTFSLWLSPGDPDDGTHSGTYVIKTQETVILNFDDDDNTQTEIELEWSNDEITSITVYYNDYEVSFVKS